MMTRRPRVLKKLRIFPGYGKDLPLWLELSVLYPGVEWGCGDFPHR